MRYLAKDGELHPHEAAPTESRLAAVIAERDKLAEQVEALKQCHAEVVEELKDAEQQVADLKKLDEAVLQRQIAAEQQVATLREALRVTVVDCEWMVGNEDVETGDLYRAVCDAVDRSRAALAATEEQAE